MHPIPERRSWIWRVQRRQAQHNLGKLIRFCQKYKFLNIKAIFIIEINYFRLTLFVRWIRNQSRLSKNFWQIRKFWIDKSSAQMEQLQLRYHTTKFHKLYFIKKKIISYFFYILSVKELHYNTVDVVSTNNYCKSLTYRRSKQREVKWININKHLCARNILNFI